MIGVLLRRVEVDGCVRTTLTREGREGWGLGVLGIASIRSQSDMIEQQ
jgi:hypothetical protein